MLTKPPASQLSVFGSLLKELSWSGASIRGVREGGRHLENVLTAEVFQALDFLPRTHFLGEVLRRASGAQHRLSEVIADIETAKMKLLPGGHSLQPTKNAKRVEVQPDVCIRAGGCLLWVEAKRVKGGSFQKDQLAKTLVLLDECAREEGIRPLLVLILGESPPVKVDGSKVKLSIRDAVAAELSTVIAQAGLEPSRAQSLLDGLNETVAHLTWNDIKAAVAEGSGRLQTEHSVSRCIHRLSSVIHEAIGANETAKAPPEPKYLKAARERASAG